MQQMIFFILFALVCCQMGQSSAATNPISSAILSGDYKLAARLSFNEAIKTNKPSWSIAIAQAKSGFLDDSIKTAKQLKPQYRGYVLYVIARDVKELSDDERYSLALEAEAIANSSEMPDGLRSELLAQIATIYLLYSKSDKATELFRSALEIANNLPSDEKNISYRRIVENLDSIANPMTFLVIFSLAENAADRSSDVFNRAFSYSSLASAYLKYGNRDKARAMLKKGISVANTILEAKKRYLALNNLAKTGIKLGDNALAEMVIKKRLGNFVDLTIREYAIEKALDGEIAIALHYADKISKHTIDDIKQKTIRDIVVILAERGNIKEAIRNVAKIDDKWGHIRGSGWLAIAKAQYKAGDRSAALSSIKKSVVPQTRDKGVVLSEFYYFHKADVVETLFQFGLYSDAKNLLTNIIEDIHGFGDRATRNKIRVLMKVVKTMTQIDYMGDFSNIILEAYELAHGYTSNYKYAYLNKAEMLSIFASELSGIMDTDKSRKFLLNKL